VVRRRSSSRRTKGLSHGQKFRKHGIRASHTAEVILDDVRVPGRCLVGGKDRLDARLARLAAGGVAGEQQALRTFEASRPTVAAMAVGVARAAFEYARDYARQRVQFGSRSARTRQSRSCSLTCRRPWPRRGC